MRWVCHRELRSLRWDWRQHKPFAPSTLYNAASFHVLNTWPPHSSRKNLEELFWSGFNISFFNTHKKVNFGGRAEPWSNGILNWFLIASILHNYKVQWGASRPNSRNLCLVNFLLVLLQKCRNLQFWILYVLLFNSMKLFKWKKLFNKQITQLTQMNTFHTTLHPWS